jgi:hypothetical protein
MAPIMYLIPLLKQQKIGKKFRLSAIPLALTDKIISVIKDKSCLFIYYPSQVIKNFSSYFLVLFYYSF